MVTAGAGPMAGISDAQLTSEGASALVEASPDGMIVVDEAGLVLVANQKIEELFGFGRAELIGRPVELLVPDRLRGLHAAHRSRYRAAPQGRPMGAGLELYGRRRDGTEFPVEISLSPIVTASGLRVIACVRDVTDRHRAEARVRMLSETMDALHDAVLMFAPDSLQFGYVNEGAVLQTGYSRDELLAMTLPQIAPEFTEAEFRALLAPLLAGELTRHGFTTLHRRKDGVDVPVEVILEYPEHADPTQARSLVAVVRDVSERRTAEADRARLGILEDRERIAGDLHDRVIQRLFATGMGLQATAGRIADEAIARRVDAAVGELDETITELRSAIFHLSERSEAEPFGERIRAVVGRFGFRLGFDPALRLTGDVDEVPGAVVEQVVPTLEEALSNVARHSRASTVTVEVAADDGGVRVSVRDDGVGIAPDAVPGSGLKSLRARAERLGGSCHVESPPGGGTIVTWRVPR